MYRTDFWTLWEKARVGCLKRTASKHVYYLGWSRSPAQAGCMRQVLRPGALGRPRGIGWRGRWEGGLGWGKETKQNKTKKCIRVPCFVDRRFNFFFIAHFSTGLLLRDLHMFAHAHYLCSKEISPMPVSCVANILFLFFPFSFDFIVFCGIRYLKKFELRYSILFLAF